MKMTIKDKLTSLKPYVLAMRFFDTYEIVDARFPKGWKVPSGNVIKAVFDEEANHHSFLSQEESIGFDELLEYVEAVIKINVEIENKHKLLVELTSELRKIFSNREMSFDKLKTLTFSFSEEEEENSLLDEYDENYGDELIDMNLFNQPNIKETKKEVVEVKKPEPVKTPEVKKPEPVEVKQPIKKLEPVKKQEPIKKLEPVKKQEPIKKPEPVKKQPINPPKNIPSHIPKDAIFYEEEEPPLVDLDQPRYEV